MLFDGWLGLVSENILQHKCFTRLVKHDRLATLVARIVFIDNDPSSGRSSRMARDTFVDVIAVWLWYLHNLFPKLD